MNKRRLLKLADLLEADAKNKHGVKFDLTSWVAPAGGMVFADRKEIAVDCSTSACAMGLACISGAFKREGLTYDFEWMNSYGGLILKPWHQGSAGFAAAGSLFGIRADEANYLFDPDEYPPGERKGATAERFVAKRIRDFVAGKPHHSSSQ